MNRKSVDALAGEWWSVALRGVLAVVVGLAIFVSPIPHSERLLRIFGVYLVIDGVVALLTAALALRRHEGWWRSALNGALGVFFGSMNLVSAGIPTATRVDLIALRTFVLGISGIVAAWQLRGALPEALPQWLLVLAGAGSIVFSLVIFLGPTIEAAVLGRLDWLATLYLVVFGVLLLAVAARLWSLSRTHTLAATA